MVKVRAYYAVIMWFQPAARFIQAVSYAIIQIVHRFKLYCDANESTRKEKWQMKPLGRD
jgi:hypothetical protein